MKKLWGIVTISLTLAGCAAPVTSPSPTPKAQEHLYQAPDDCKIESILELDPSWEAFDQTDSPSGGMRVCAIGVPNSDIGVFFSYQESDAEQWGSEKATLESEGYKPFDIGHAETEVMRFEEASGELGPSCRIAGYADGVTFTITEPGFECDDEWNKQLAVAVLDQAKK
ncbi:MAG: hypothetical protein RLZ53_573 [Actinomycetota bacterium]